VVGEEEPVQTPEKSNSPPRRRQKPWMEALLADWQERWPAAFTNPVPLAIGVAEHMKAAIAAEGVGIDRRKFGIALRYWTHQGAYLHALRRGGTRRNLDGSAAGIPSAEDRQHAKEVLNERAARNAARERQKQERKQAGSGGETPQISPAAAEVRISQ
jgi:ProP effector